MAADSAKGKGLAILLGGAKPPEDESTDSNTNALSAAAQSVLDAISASDADALATALSDFIDLR